MYENRMEWNDSPMTEQMFTDLWDENGNLTRVARSQIIVDEFCWTLEGQDGLPEAAFQIIKERLLQTLVAEWSLPDEYEDLYSMMCLVIDV